MGDETPGEIGGTSTAPIPAKAQGASFIPLGESVPPDSGSGAWIPWLVQSAYPEGESGASI